MSQVHLIFHDDLNEFLSRVLRWQEFDYAFYGTPSIKHLIEALCIPHTEVGRIVVNECSLDVRYLVHEYDRIEVFPIVPQTSEILNNNQKTAPDLALCFLLDNHLGRLAIY